MKYFIILWLFGHVQIYALGDVESSYLAGNKALAAQKYTEAITAYTSIDASAFDGVGLHKNLAVAYAGLKNFPMAILHYEKALKIKPNDGAIRSDLKTIRSQVTSLDESPKSHWVMSSVMYVVGVFGEFVWAWLSLLAMAMVGWLIVTARDRTRSKTFRYIGLLSVFVAICMVAASHRSHRVYGTDAMVITQDNVHLKAGPDQASPDVESLVPGSKLYISDQLEGWFMVTSELGDTGWVMDTQGQKI